MYQGYQEKLSDLKKGPCDTGISMGQSSQGFWPSKSLVVLLRALPVPVVGFRVRWPFALSTSVGRWVGHSPRIKCSERESPALAATSASAELFKARNQAAEIPIQ